MGWLGKDPGSAGLRLHTFRELLSELDEDVHRAGEVFGWLGSSQNDGNLPMVGIDETLPDRCRRVYELPIEPRGEDDERWQENFINVSVILAELSRVGKLGVQLLTQLGVDVVAKTSPPYWMINERHLRGSSWVSWRLRATAGPSPGIRLHVDADGFLISLNAEVNVNPKGFIDHFRNHFNARLPAGTSRKLLDTNREGPATFVEADLILTAEPEVWEALITTIDDACAAVIGALA
jgi:hypothetical protein